MKSRMTPVSVILIVLASVVAATATVTWLSFKGETRRLRTQMMEESQIIKTERGAVEYASRGEGAPVLVVHGAAGGYDQGLFLAKSWVGEGFHVIAPSRFGYLRTPLPADPSPVAQADALAGLLDALDIRKVTVVGISAGAPSSMQFALRYPQRTSSLVLIVPAAYVPDPPEPPAEARSVALSFILTGILRSDFPLFLGIKVNRSRVLSTMGVPPSSQVGLTDAEKNALIRQFLPFSPRMDGMMNDGKTVAALDRYPLETIGAPTLVISARDDAFFPGMFERARYTAENIPGAKFRGFETGGHFLMGHDGAVRSEVARFIRENGISG